MPDRGGLISSAELARLLERADLRLFDCTTYLEYQPEGSAVPYIAVPGRHTFEAGHIPGADFLESARPIRAPTWRSLSQTPNAPKPSKTATNISGAFHHMPRNSSFISVVA